MDGSLAQHVAIVTGGGSGLGRIIAKTLAAEGAIVTVADVDPDRGQAAAAELERAIFVRTDLTDPASVEALARQVSEQYGQIDLLVNNAAITGNHPQYRSENLLDVPVASWRWILDVNVTGQFLCMQAVARVMARQRRGVIVNISSIAGLLPTPRTAAYGVSKAAVAMLTRCAAVDLAEFEIRVNAVAPNGMYRPESNRPRPKAHQQILANRVAEFGDVADVVAFLCSDAARYINGQVISVDGGETVGMRRRPPES